MRDALRDLWRALRRRGIRGQVEDIEVGDTIVVLGLPDITCPTNAKGVILLPGGDESSS